MIDGLCPYPELKETDLPWLGHVPAHWEVLRSGSVFREVVQTGFPSLELLSIKSGVGIVKQSSTGRRIRASEDRSLYKRIEPGWLGYNLMNAFFGGIGISSIEGILSPAYAVARPKFEIHAKYFHYLYQSPVYLTQFNRESYGIMYERNRLYFDRFKIIPCPIPPLREQQLIVRFLLSQPKKVSPRMRGFPSNSSKKHPHASYWPDGTRATSTACIFPHPCRLLPLWACPIFPLI